MISGLKRGLIGVITESRYYLFMTSIFDITGNDIALLNDADLRDLIGLLCEADYRSQKLPTTGILFGGDQNASDGGVDVSVSGAVPPPTTSFIPRSNTAFQVKKPDMPASEIAKEMAPDGILKDAIKELITIGGSYIIVSAQGSTSKTAIQRRIDAMKAAISGESENRNLHVDFYDRGRIATWVRNHPSMILWVRSKIGRPLKGWRPYENWSRASTIDEEYLIDKTLRLVDGESSMGKNSSLGIEDGLIRLRTALEIPKSSIRLAGLSGVGKTRFVQALFDDRIGKNALNQSEAIYTDLSDNPSPDPRTLAEQLISTKTKAILIVDNCTQDLHRKLTEICCQGNSTVSLLTVEYDVREDLPEETQVFRLMAASDEIIGKLLLRRFPKIGQINAAVIAKFSGGNARLAIALAHTIKEGETLTGMKDDELFKRLFWQRNESDDNLLASAEVLSLLYSFNGEDLEKETSELNILGSLIEKSGDKLYRDTKTLQDRDLVQSRDIWRAILPHAIANRLAKNALKTIHKKKITDTILGSGSERIILSFTKRLNYLHDSDVAAEIAKEWLSPAGWIGKDILHLNSFGMNAFRNLAPISPIDTFSAIERAAMDTKEGDWFTSPNNPYHADFLRILRQLACEPDLFERCVNLMVKFSTSDNQEIKKDIEPLKSLFFLKLSGTHAPLAKRAEFIDGLLKSSSIELQELGLTLLDAALEAWHFSSMFEFSFGARPRDYGYYPQTQKDVEEWYNTFINLTSNHALSSSPTAEKAQQLLSQKLRALWTQARVYTSIEKSVREIVANSSSGNIWVGLKRILEFDAKSFDSQTRDRLNTLIALAKPKSLLHEAKLYALSEHESLWNVDDEDTETDDSSTEIKARMEKMERRTKQIAIEVSKDKAVYDNIKSQLVTVHSSRSFTFGEGLAEGCSNLKEFWESLKNEYINAPEEKRKFGVLRGFLSACSRIDPTVADEILDSLIEEPILGLNFPVFQSVKNIDEKGVKRLMKCLQYGIVNVWSFQYIAWGRVHEPIDDDSLADLVELLLNTPAGGNVAIEILKMRFHGESRSFSEKLLSQARNTLIRFPHEGNKRGNLQDYDISEIAVVSLKGTSAEKDTTIICKNFFDAVTSYRIYAFDFPKYLRVIAKHQPNVFLDELFANNLMTERQLSRIITSDIDQDTRNPIDEINSSVILKWCDIQPDQRYPFIASIIHPFVSVNGQIEWNPIILNIFDKAPDLEIILDNIENLLRPTSWMGSRADIMQGRRILIDTLLHHEKSEISSWAAMQSAKLQEEIIQEREREDNWSRQDDQRFE